MIKAMKIKVLEWEETRLNGQELETFKVKTPELIRSLIRLTPTHLLPMGLETFSLMKDLNHSLETSKTEKELILGKSIYQWLKDNVFPLIPASWGLNPDISAAIDEVLNAQEFELKP